MAGQSGKPTAGLPPGPAARAVGLEESPHAWDIAQFGNTGRSSCKASTASWKLQRGALALCLIPVPMCGEALIPTWAI